MRHRTSVLWMKPMNFRLFSTSTKNLGALSQKEPPPTGLEHPSLYNEDAESTISYVSLVLSGFQGLSRAA